MRRIKVLHVEPTDVCQAACPMCAKEVDPTCVLTCTAAKNVTRFDSQWQREIQLNSN